MFCECFNLKDRKISVISNNNIRENIPVVILNTFKDNAMDIAKLCKGECIFIAVHVTDWDDSLSPWYSPALFKGDPDFSGEADDYLLFLTDTLLPFVMEKYSIDYKRLIIAGYSLAGLFSVYSLYKTDIFCGAVSASGSMWYPGFIDFCKENKIKSNPRAIYFSLGDKESKTKRQPICFVEEYTKDLCLYFSNMGINSTFELNPGNHFKDSDIRTAKGIDWVLNRI